MLRWVLKKVEVVLTAREEQRVVLLLRFEIGDLSFTDIMFKGLEVILICLCVLDQVLFECYPLFLFVGSLWFVCRGGSWSPAIFALMATKTFTFSSCCLTAPVPCFIFPSFRRFDIAWW